MMMMMMNTPTHQGGGTTAGPLSTPHLLTSLIDDATPALRSCVQRNF